MWIVNKRGELRPFKGSSVEFLVWTYKGVKLQTTSPQRPEAHLERYLAHIVMGDPHCEFYCDLLWSTLVRLISFYGYIAAKTFTFYCLLYSFTTELAGVFWLVDLTDSAMLNVNKDNIFCLWFFFWPWRVINYLSYIHVYIFSF